MSVFEKHVCVRKQSLFVHKPAARKVNKVSFYIQKQRYNMRTAE